MKSRIKNERGDMSFFSIFIILAINMLLSFVLLYASVQINCINIRNAAKMELNNVSARIYADTFHSQREANLTSYMSDISLSTAYKNALRAGFTEGMRSRVKLTNDDYRVYTLLGDGEIQEGQIWEAAMWAGHRKLDNLVVIVDNNNLQIDGSIEDVCSPYPIDKKFEAFNFHVINIDGNDFDQIRAAFKEARETKGMPTAIIAKTVKGKGVSFMENAAGWHGKAPNDEEYEIAMADLEKAGEALCQK